MFNSVIYAFSVEAIDANRSLCWFLIRLNAAQQNLRFCARGGEAAEVDAKYFITDFSSTGHRSRR
ncbi:uncharacterized protein METZ01_LOCUS173656 [marine metagenome]|uniref:Uncharacterized protein n=1 Tax=marine metagenome TaxID=408172 RepID=A0A382C4V4_9ZZZZ